LAPFCGVEEDAISAADDRPLAQRPPGETDTGCKDLESVRVLGASPARVLIVLTVDDAGAHKRLVGDKEATRRIIQVAPRHTIARFVRQVAVVPPQTEVEGPVCVDAPVVLEILREVLEVEFAWVARGPRHPERRRPDGADAGG